MLVAAAFASADAVARGGGNLAPNPGFEEPLTKPDFRWAAYARCTVERTDETACEGAYSVCIRCAGPEQLHHGSAGGLVPVKTNTVYTISCRVKTENASAKLGVRFFNGDKKAFGGDAMPQAAQGVCDWTWEGITVNSGNACFFSPYFMVCGRGGTAWFDDYRIVEGRGTNRVNLLPNSSFNKCTTPGYPDFWSVMPQNVLDVPDWETGNYYGVSGNETSPVIGTKVVFLRSPGAKGLMAYQVKLLAGQPYFFSAYMKADRDDFEVSLSGEKFRVSREWKRYSFSRGCAERLPPHLIFGTAGAAGTLFIAAPMIEASETLDEWTPSSVESDAHWLPAKVDRLEENTACLDTTAWRKPGEATLPSPPSPAAGAAIKFLSPRIVGQTFFTALAFDKPETNAYVAELTFKGVSVKKAVKPAAARIPLMFELPSPPGPDDEVALRVVLEGDGKEQAVFRRRVMHLTAKDPSAELQILAEYNWYPENTRRAAVKVSSFLSGPHRVTVSLDGAEVKVLDFPGAGVRTFWLKVKKLSGPRHRLLAEAKSDGQVASYAEDDLRLLPAVKGSTTRVNRFTRVLEKDGEPLLPILFHPIAHRPLKAWTLPMLKRDGYNGLCPILPMGRVARSMEATDKLLQDAAANQLAVLVWMNGYNKAGAPYTNMVELLDDQREMGSAFAEYPGIIGCYLTDEPSPGTWEGVYKFKESDLLRMAEVSRSVDPHRPTTVNYFASGYTPGRPAYGGFAAMDFMSFDSYPHLDHGCRPVDPMEDFMRDTLKYNDSMGPIGYPVFCWLESYGYGDAYRLPTPDEVENMVWTALIGGTRGLQYFIDYPASVPLIKRMRAVHGKVRAVTPVLVDPRTESVTVHEGYVHAAAYRLKGKTCVIVANTAALRRGLLKIPGVGDLSLAPLQSGVYRLEGKRLEEIKEQQDLPCVAVAP